jgi:hypothetical protein
MTHGDDAGRDASGAGDRASGRARRRRTKEAR